VNLTLAGQAPNTWESFGLTTLDGSSSTVLKLSGKEGNS